MGLRPLGTAVWLTPINKKPPPRMCYHVKYGRSASKVYAYIEGNLQNWGVLGLRPLVVGRGGAGLTPGNTPAGCRVLGPARPPPHLSEMRLKLSSEVRDGAPVA